MSAGSGLPRLVIAGAHSGVGKTTVATGVIAALRGRGLTVQPFKVGPDYIDPTFHSLAAGVASRNLDSWMLERDSLLELFCRAAGKAEIAVIEGVMGLFDGHSGLDGSGSTAQVAKLLRTPVVLILDTGRMARSAGAAALGYAKFDPALELKGFIANNIGSPQHWHSVKKAIEEATELPVVGYLPRNRAELRLPERHLGLVPAGEHRDLAPFLRHLEAQIRETVDVDRLLEIARSAEALPIPQPRLFSTSIAAPSVNIALARDEAFSFYYEDNLDLLESRGAKLLPFSPLHGHALPAETQGIYLGGGFPEVYARDISENRMMMEQMTAAAAAGMPIYAECGGLMYLSEGVVTSEGARYPMVGLVPGWALMKDRLSRMGYVEVELQKDTIVAHKGVRLRGHEFHWSEMTQELSPSAYMISRPQVRNEGYAGGNILASFIHLHFGSEPTLAGNLVEACRQWAACRTPRP